MKFRIKCPSCRAKEKWTDRCRICYKEVCSECSINSLCVDCYVNTSTTIEIEHYWMEKYGMIV